MKTNLLKLAILILLFTTIHFSSFSQEVIVPVDPGPLGIGPIQLHSASLEVVDILNYPINVSIDERNSISNLFSKPRFNSTLTQESFQLNNINQLLLLKDLLDFLPSDRTILNERMRGIGTGYCCDAVGIDPCMFNMPTNNHKIVDRLSVNYQIGGAVAMPINGTWADAVFDINLKNSCNNTSNSIMYVGLDKRFGFGTNQPMATYHFATPDMLIGDDNGFNFQIKNEANKEHIRLSNGGDILFLVDNAGKVFAKEFEVSLNIAFPDYVFKDDYKLLPLSQLEDYIKKNKHLPGIKSASEYQEAGKISITELQIKTLEKVEELTLYTLNQEKQIKAQSLEIEELKKAISSILLEKN